MEGGSVLMAVYYIQHTKADCIKFVGHLDLQTTIHRNINRAELKIAFSQGFSPHMLMSSAQPLSVGVSSEAEYLMVELDTAKSELEILNDLNRTAPAGISYKKVRLMEPGTSSPMSLLDAVESVVKIPSTQDFAETIRTALNGNDPMLVVTTNKKGVESTRDIRPLIKPGATVVWSYGYTTLTLTTYAGCRRHLNLDHLLKYLKETAPGVSPNRFIHIRRLGMYTERNGELISLGDI